MDAVLLVFSWTKWKHTLQAWAVRMFHASSWMHSHWYSRQAASSNP